MPDLKSELMKLDNLTFDDDVGGEPAPITTDKPNISKLIWDTIKANPNKTSIEIANLMNNGDMSGIATRLKQMLDRGVLERTQQNGYWTYTAVGDSYPAFNRAEAMAKAQAARLEKKLKREKQKEYNARYKAKKQITVVRAQDIPATSLSSNPSAEQLVNSMSVGMAKAVYLELKKVFEA
jgi:hypothetical protein